MSCPCENNNNALPNIECTDPNTCVEIISLDCISYVGTEKKCGDEVVYENGDSLSTVQSKIVDYFCDKIEPAPNCFTHYIGEEYGGGVVFHVYKDALGEEHGLICSIVNQSTSSQYSNVSDLIGTTNSWNGQFNTTAMANQSGASSGAWKYCQDYSYQGFNDWYLPAIDELKLLFANRYNVNKTLSTIITSEPVSYIPFGEYRYISSTEYNNTIAFGIVIETETLTADLKSNGFFYVRAIRQF